MRDRTGETIGGCLWPYVNSIILKSYINQFFKATMEAPAVRNYQGFLLAITKLGCFF